MNNFNDASPSGNGMVDRNEPKQYIENIEDLEIYLADHLPAFTEGEKDAIREEYRKISYYEY